MAAAACTVLEMACPGPDAPVARRRALDDESSRWIAALEGEGRRRDEAVARLHDLLLRAARFEISRRRAALAQLPETELDDLATQAAGDALMAVLAKLDGFRGDSRFTTWAYKFALLEAAVKVRRRAWRDREVTLGQQAWETIADDALAPDAAAEGRELVDVLRESIAGRLTAHQRDVLVALAIEGVPVDVLAERLGTTRGALYKSLHDARRKLRAELAGRGFPIEHQRATTGGDPR